MFFLDFGLNRDYFGFLVAIDALGGFGGVMGYSCKIHVFKEKLRHFKNRVELNRGPTFVSPVDVLDVWFVEVFFVLELVVKSFLQALGVKQLSFAHSSRCVSFYV